MIVRMFTFCRAQGLNRHSPVVVQPDGTAISLDKAFTESVARILRIGFVVTVGVPDTTSSIFEFKQHGSCVFSDNFGIQSS